MRNLMLNHRTVSVLLVLPLVVYLYVLFARIIRIFSAKYEGWKMAVTVGAAILCAIPVLDLYSFGAMVVLHMIVFGLLTDVVWWICGKICRSRMVHYGSRTYKRRRYDFEAMQSKYNPYHFWNPCWNGEQLSFGNSCMKAALPWLFTAAVLLYGYLNTQVIVRTEYQVETEKKIRPEGYTVAFLSDLHIGTTMEPQKLERICEKIEEDVPDLVILGGDIVDENSTLEEVQQVFSVLSEIDSEFGTFYVYGNHDKGFYDSRCAFTPKQLETAILAWGIRILEDETVVLNEELTLSGRRDRTEARYAGVKRISAAKLLDMQQTDSYHIVVDHQPRQIAENAAASFDLMLSGHTHGGQIWPVGPLSTLTDTDSVNYGHVQEGQMNVIVSSGIAGWRYPVRTGKHCEYVILHVEKVKDLPSGEEPL